MNDEHTEGEIITRSEKAEPAALFGQLLMTMLSNPDIPAEKMHVVMAMRREVLADEAREAYQSHFAAFAQELPVVERDGMVDMEAKGKFPFTTYEQMDKVLRPLLAKHGFSLQFWSSAPETRDLVVVHGALIGWGWQRDATYPVPPDTGPGRNALQARGSAQTYAKRYIADLLCNVVRKGKDDDGKGAMEALIDARQIKTLDDLLKKTNTEAANFLRIMVTGCEELADIRQRDFARLELALRDKLKKTVRKEIQK